MCVVKHLIGIISFKLLAVFLKQVFADKETEVWRGIVIRPKSQSQQVG